MLKQLALATLLFSISSIHCAQQSAHTNHSISFSHDSKPVPIFKVPCITMYVGNAAIADLTWDKASNSAAQIDELYVLPAHRAKGYGHILLEYALAIFAKDFTTVSLESSAFERKGHKLNGESHPHPDRLDILPKLKRFYFDHGFTYQKRTNRPSLMHRTLVPRSQALASIKPACLASIPNTLE